MRWLSILCGGAPHKQDRSVDSSCWAQQSSFPQAKNCCEYYARPSDTSYCSSIDCAGSAVPAFSSGGTDPILSYEGLIVVGSPQQQRFPGNAPRMQLLSGNLQSDDIQQELLLQQELPSEHAALRTDLLLSWTQDAWDGLLNQLLEEASSPQTATQTTTMPAAAAMEHAGMASWGTEDGDSSSGGGIVAGKTMEIVPCCAAVSKLDLNFLHHPAAILDSAEAADDLMAEFGPLDLNKQ